MRTNGIEALGLQIERLTAQRESHRRGEIFQYERAEKEVKARAAAERELAASKMSQEPAPPKVGTWAWACEMAFKNPGKKYAYSSSNADQTMFASCSQLFNGENNPFLVVTQDVSATDWREVTP